jgi:hypothetical protein
VKLIQLDHSEVMKYVSNPYVYLLLVDVNIFEYVLYFIFLYFTLFNSLLFIFNLYTTFIY